MDLNYLVKHGHHPQYLLRAINCRNHLLRDTDYFMVIDVYEKLSVEQKEEIREYRQKLRDFINENKDKYLEGQAFIEFPKQPEFVKIPIPKY